MNIVFSLLILPFFTLWLFLIWWLVKPKFFPSSNTLEIPSRKNILLNTLAVYIALLVVLMIVTDISDPAATNSFSISEGIGLVVSFFFLIGLIKESLDTGKKRQNNLSNSDIKNFDDNRNIKPPFSNNKTVIKDNSSYNNSIDDDLFEQFPELNDLEFDDNGDLKTSFEPEPWTTKHDDADFQIGIYNNNADLKLYYCKIDDLYKNKKGDWVVGVIDTKNYTDKTFNIHKIDDLEDKLGIRYVLYEDMVQAFADELGIEIDVWGEEEEIFEVTDEVEETPPKSEVKIPIAPRKRVPKEDPSHSMVYVDSKGNLSEREINLRNVEAKDGKLYVHAYCFKRKRLRTFVAKNIVSLYDLTTKQTFTDEDEVYNELLSWVLENE